MTEKELKNIREECSKQQCDCRGCNGGKKCEQGLPTFKIPAKWTDTDIKKMCKIYYDREGQKLIKDHCGLTDDRIATILEVSIDTVKSYRCGRRHIPIKKLNILRRVAKKIEKF